MRKIIGRKTYDVKRAYKLGTWKSEYEDYDPLYLRESLYLKKDGDFFLVTETFGGSDIAQMPKTDAVLWLTSKMPFYNK